MSIIKCIRNMFKTKKPVLGRWHLKHDLDYCDKYMNINHADPGYEKPYKKIKNVYMDLDNCIWIKAPQRYTFNSSKLETFII